MTVRPFSVASKCVVSIGLLTQTTALLVCASDGDHGEELFEHGWIGHASTAVEA